MKKYKDFFKSIIIILLFQGTIYYITKLLIPSHHIMHTFFSFPLIKEFVFIYDSWYPIIFLTSLLIYKKNKENYYNTVYTIIVGIILSYLTFYIYPTKVITPIINVNSFTDFALYITYYLDTPAVNCLPSIHCLFSYILIYYICISKNLNFKYKITIVTYLILIILSTVLIHQHIIEDVILALIYTIIAVIITKIFNNQLKRIFKFLF